MTAKYHVTKSKICHARRKGHDCNTQKHLNLNPPSFPKILHVLWVVADRRLSWMETPRRRLSTDTHITRGLNTSVRIYTPCRESPSKRATMVNGLER